MRLFHYRRGTGEAPVPGLREVAAGQDWQPAPAEPFERDVADAVYEIGCDLYGVPRGYFGLELGRPKRKLTCRDAFRFTDAGRTVTVANARAILGPEAQFMPGPPKDVAVCAVAVPALLAPGLVQARGYPRLSRLAPAPTGDAAFDGAYLTSVADVGAQWLTPDVRRILLTHDDWVLLAVGATLVCLSQGAFAAATDVEARVRDVLELLAAIPPELVPTHVDSSVDDLAVRIGRIGSVEHAVAFLQQLSDADRERLARSDSPLAHFADVRTPEQAMSRFQSLDPARQMQLMATFMRAGGGAR